ncbi:MAG: autotransporter-associated beta strand repeat-containing protein [Akkermansiaceae bacterium]
MKPKQPAIRRFTHFMCAGSAAALLTSHSAHAGTITWDSANATTTSWALGSNWIGGNAPVAGDDVVITADGTQDPTDNSAYTEIALNSLTKQGANDLTVTSSLQVGAGGVYNNGSSGNLFLKTMTLTANQTWRGAAGIYVNVVNSEAFKMTFEGVGMRFDGNSPSWSGGLDIRTTVNMSGGFAGSTTSTPYGTGTVTLINRMTDGTTRTDPILQFASAASNLSLATATILPNDIVLSALTAGNFTFNQSQDAATLAGGHWYNLTGNITGNGGVLLLKNSKGVSAPVTYILSGTNTTTAQIVLEGDHVNLALGNVNAMQGATLHMNFNGVNATRDVKFTLAGTNTYNLGGLAGTDGLNLGANTISVGGFNASRAFAGVISGSGGFTKAGSGTQTLSGANTYSGSTAISAGILSLTNSLALQNSALDTTASITGTTTGGLKTDQTTLRLGGLIGDKSLASVFTTTSGGYGSVTGLVLNPGTGMTNSYSGAISNGAAAMTLTKSGDGTQVLSGTNTYTGVTTVSAGDLRINGIHTGSGAVNVGAAGTLGGSGSVIGGINVSGILAPGNSIESLGGGALSFTTGSTYAYEINTADFNGDLTYSSGGLDIAGGTILTLTDLASSTALAADSKLTLISSVEAWNGGLFSYDAGAGLTTLADDSTFTLGANQWRFNYNDTSGGSNFTGDQTGATNFVTMTVIPEPSAALLGGLGLLVLLRRRRCA